ncbi:MAG: DUF6677 family protein [Planctomycetota bacterium]
MTLSPRNATLLSLVLPGSAHFLLGRPVRGLAALATTMALFFVGWAVLRDRMWFFSYVTPSGFFASILRVLPLHLLPEGLNVGAAAVASLLRDTAQPYAAERLMRMPVHGESWATMLTGASGILSVIWAADAHWLSRGVRSARVSPALAVFWSWVVPGAGHAMAGQKSKGVVMGVAVAVVFALGMVISSGHGVDRQYFGLWWSGAALFAPGLLVASLWTQPLEWGGEISPLLEYGVALCTCAGLMNAMIMSDAFTVAEHGAGAPAAEVAA